MKRDMRIGFTAVIVALSLLAGPATARPNSLLGKWRLNLKQSELLPGEEPPSELTMAITRDEAAKPDSSFSWTVTVTMPDGASGTTGFDGAIDGKAYPVRGRPGSTSAFSWTPDGSLKQVSQSAGGFAVEICAFTPNGKRMTCSARQTDTKGRAVTYLEVFDRE